MELFIYLFAALFSVLNPIGTIPIFVGMTQSYNKKERFRVSLWTSINVLIILVIVFFCGEYVMGFFGISIDALRIAGGIVIATSGFALLTGKFGKRNGLTKKVEQETEKRPEIALTPLAIPILAGPGAISLLIAFHHEHHTSNDVIIALSALLAVVIVIFAMLRSAHFIANMLGDSGIVAFSRIIGFIVIAIGVQYIVAALLDIVKDNFPHI